jgi:methionyl-tRNA formyltransferase
LQARTSITPEDNAGTLHDKLAEIGAEIVLHTVRLIEQGKAVPHKQDDTVATPAPKIFKENCRINWDQPAEQVRNFVRGLSPHPTAFTTHEGRVIKIFRARVLDKKCDGASGTVSIVGASLEVCVRRGVIAIEDLQQEGRKRLGIEEVLRGYRIQRGERFT